MLVLTRRPGQTIVIDNNIQVTIVGVQGKKIRLGITAPDYMRVDRQEVHEKRIDVVGDDGAFVVAGADSREIGT